MPSEGFLTNVPKPKITSEEILKEEEADRLLDELLEDPENSFLLQHQQNKAKLESLPPIEALAFARNQIAARAERTSQLVAIPAEIFGRTIHLNRIGIEKNLGEVFKHAQEIGRGGDAYVIIDKSEVRDIPPEVCYKIALNEATPRGRNSVRTEFDLQIAFYQVVSEMPQSKIGVPIPFYVYEGGSHKIIAMEKLEARSLDDLINGRGGTLPKWFNVDVFLNELRTIFDEFHTKGLYHRDMHLGNIMISQKPEYVEGDKIGFVIDFGLSAKDGSGLDPYTKEVAGSTFKYDDDYGIIKAAKTALELLKNKRT